MSRNIESPAKDIPKAANVDMGEPSPTLMSPSTQTHPCQEALFPNEDQIEEKSDRVSIAGSIQELQGSISVEDEDGGDSDQFEDAREDVSPRRHSSLDDSGNASFDMRWHRHKKHIFILSDAGKPIFHLHGDDEEVVSLTGVMQALVSYVTDLGDSFRSIFAPQGRMVFLNKSPLILVAVTQGVESESQLIVQLTYMYNQVLSLLTLSQINRVFERRQGFDLRRMLAGSERILQSLSNAIDTDPCFLLSAIRVLPMAPTLRDPISASITQACAKDKNVVFAILIADNQLVTLVRMKKYFLHPADLHLIFNLVNNSESFKVSETWMPICLPKFDSSGFMQAHVSYLKEDHPACLIMLTVERNIFYEISETKKAIVQSLEKTKSLSAIIEALEKSHFKADSIGSEIRHFLYKAKTAAQFTSSSYAEPYRTEAARRRLHNHYLRLQNRIHSLRRPLRLIYQSGQKENVIGWITQSFELYASLTPTASKTNAIGSINKLLRWCKKDEQTLFILDAPTY